MSAGMKRCSRDFLQKITKPEFQDNTLLETTISKILVKFEKINLSSRQLSSILPVFFESQPVLW
jgi:hypothetical protein